MLDTICDGHTGKPLNVDQKINSRLTVMERVKTHRRNKPRGLVGLDEILARVAPNEIFGVSVKWTISENADVCCNGRVLAGVGVVGRIDGDQYKIFGDGHSMPEDYTQADIEMAVREAVFGAIGMLHNRMRSL
jgi:hypothetical protein